MSKTIKSMTPLTNDHGDVVRAITTQNVDTGKTIKRFYNKVDVKGHVLYVPRETEPEATVIRKPLFEVVDDEGTSYRMTKRQAKKAFSGRQVRKALKRLSADLTNSLRQERRAALDARRPDEKPEYFSIEAMADRMGIDPSEFDELKEAMEAQEAGAVNPDDVSATNDDADDNDSDDSEDSAKTEEDVENEDDTNEIT